MKTLKYSSDNSSNNTKNNEASLKNSFTKSLVFLKKKNLFQLNCFTIYQYIINIMISGNYNEKRIPADHHKSLSRSINLI